MKRCVLAAAAVLMFGHLGSGVSGAANRNSIIHNGLLHYIETDAAMYWMHGPVDISYSITNVTEDSIGLTFSCMHGGIDYQLWVRIYPPDGPIAWADPPGCYYPGWYGVLGPGESYSRETTWDMWNMIHEHYITQPGMWRIRGSDFIVSPPEYHHWVDVEIEILDPATGMEEGPPRTWSVIKALYR